MKTLVTSAPLKKSFLTKRDLLSNVVVLLALIAVDADPTQSAKSGFNFDNTWPARSQLLAFRNKLLRLIRQKWARPTLGICAGRRFLRRSPTDHGQSRGITHHSRSSRGYWFGLTRAEALLIDVQEADHGHCLEIDIREQHPRSRRRLILILTSEQRQAVDYAARVFDTADGTPIGSEGNYRQRIYRFRSLMSTRRENNRNRA